MKKEKKYIEYILKQAEALLAIDSPSGFTEKVTDYLCFLKDPSLTRQGFFFILIDSTHNILLSDTDKHHIWYL